MHPLPYPLYPRSHTDSAGALQDPAMLLRESLGISADGSEKCFRTTDIEAFEAAVPLPLKWDDRDHRNNVRFVFTAVDPSGGGASAFSIASVIVYEGKIQVSTAPPPHPTPHTLYSTPTSRTAPHWSHPFSSNLSQRRMRCRATAPRAQTAGLHRYQAVGPNSSEKWE